MTNPTCGATTRHGEPCELPAGWGTDHVGEGRCKLHGGASLRGEESGTFKHGLFSDYLGEEDRDAIDKLGDYDDVDKLDELIDWRLARLRRAVREMNDETDDRGFWDALDTMVRQGSMNGREPGLSASQMGELARMIGMNESALQDEIDLVRKLIKDRNKIAEGEDHNVNLTDVLMNDADA